MSFLDVTIIREKDKFTTSVYRKPTFSGIYTHFDSVLPSSNKIGLLRTDVSGFAQIGLILRTLLIIVLKCFWITNIEYKKKW